VSKTFPPYNPDQLFLMPVSMQEWLPPDHLDLSVVMSRYEDEEQGYPPYRPRMMAKVLLYAYCIGGPFSRRIAKRLQEGGVAANPHRSQPDEALWRKELGISGARNVSLGLDRAMHCQRVHEKQVRHDQMPSAFDLCPLLSTPCLAKMYFT
jgi:hypothetical protein